MKEGLKTIPKPKGEATMYYEIIFHNNVWKIWKWTNNGITVNCELFKVFKTRKGAENWARKQWDEVIWR